MLLVKTDQRRPATATEIGPVVRAAAAERGGIQRAAKAGSHPSLPSRPTRPVTGRQHAQHEINAAYPVRPGKWRQFSQDQSEPLRQATQFETKKPTHGPIYRKLVEYS